MSSFLNVHPDLINLTKEQLQEKVMKARRKLSRTRQELIWSREKWTKDCELTHLDTIDALLISVEIGSMMSKFLSFHSSVGMENSKSSS